MGGGNRKGPGMFHGAGLGLMLALLFYGGVVPPPEATAATKTLRIAAAADLMPVLPALVRQFSRETQIRVRVSYGASGELALSITRHAPFDLFLSADSSYPETLSRKGKVLPESVRTYARGSLVLWYSREVFPSAPALKPRLSLLADRRIGRVALSNPGLTPYGRAAVFCLKSRQLWGEVKRKTVYGNSLAQVAQYLETKTADAGFLSEGQAQELSKHIPGEFLSLSPSCVPFLEQKMAIVTASRHLPEARAFERFLLDRDSGIFLKLHGYR